MLTATACSNDETVEVPQGAAIGFKTMIDKNAGRAATELTTDNIAAFSVYGWAGNALIFNDEAVAKNGAQWVYSPVQYWEEKAYEFVAIASDKGANCTATFAPSQTPGEGTITFASDGNEDLVYDTYARDNSAAINDAVVPFEFKHALSRVRFTFVNGVNGNLNFSISNVRINNAISDGTLAINANPGWEMGETEKAVNCTIQNTVLTNKAGENTVTSDYQYIIPGAQSLTINFDITITTPAGTETKTHRDVAIALPNGSTYAMGSSYNFTATFDESTVDPDKVLKPIEFTVTKVENWGADNEDVVTVK